MKLHLACGGNYKPGFLNVDISDKARKDAYANLFEFPWPWSDNLFDAVECHHFVEHIPHRLPGTDKDGMVRFMEECWRVMTPGAEMKISHPHPMSEASWGDPTHCRNIVPLTWYYFDKEWRAQSVGGIYEWNCDFEVVATAYRVDCKEGETEEAKQFLIHHMPNSVSKCFATLKARK